MIRKSPFNFTKNLNYFSFWVLLVHYSIFASSAFILFFIRKEGNRGDAIFAFKKTGHLGSLTAANWVSFDFNVAYSSR